MVGLDPIIGVPLGTARCDASPPAAAPPPRSGRSLLGRSRPRRVPPSWCRWPARRTGGQRWRPAVGDEHVDDLPVLVDRLVHVAPLPGHLHVGLVHIPALADPMPTWPGG